MLRRSDVRHDLVARRRPVLLDVGQRVTRYTVARYTVARCSAARNWTACRRSSRRRAERYGARRAGTVRAGTVRAGTVRAGTVRAGARGLAVAGSIAAEDDNGRGRASAGPGRGIGAFDAPQGTTRRRQHCCRAQYHFKPPRRLQNLGVPAEPPQLLAVGTCRPREGQRAADKAEQHPDEEPAKVRGNPGTERQHNREQ
jgi:hypothetical protein